MENIKMQPVYGMLNLRETRELAKGSYEYIIKDIKDIKNKIEEYKEKKLE